MREFQDNFISLDEYLHRPEFNDYKHNRMILIVNMLQLYNNGTCLVLVAGIHN